MDFTQNRYKPYLTSDYAVNRIEESNFRTLALALSLQNDDGVLNVQLLPRAAAVNGYNSATAVQVVDDAFAS
jgi:hypothetical protein